MPIPTYSSPARLPSSHPSTSDQGDAHSECPRHRPSVQDTPSVCVRGGLLTGSAAVLAEVAAVQLAGAAPARVQARAAFGGGLGDRTVVDHLLVGCEQSQVRSEVR